MPRTSSRWLVAGAIALAVGATAMTTPPPSDDVDYRYCYFSKQPYGDVVYFSSAFSVKGGTYAVGIQNSFNSFVTARYDSDAISGAHCMGPYNEYQDAEDKLNDHIGERRRSGKRVVLTSWRYRGD